jgi:toxin FitB
MNVVDSSGWLEYFSDGPNAGFFSGSVQDIENLVVPTISVLEVFKRVADQRGEEAALRVIAVMNQGRLVDLDVSMAIQAARMSQQHKLPLADSVILATARKYEAILWTQDADFKGLEGVKYVAKKSLKTP